MVDANTRETLQLIRDSRIPLWIKQEIDSKIRHMEGAACVGCGLDDCSAWTTQAERGTCEFLCTAGGLMDGGFSAGGIEWDAMIAGVEFKLRFLTRAVSAYWDRHVSGSVKTVADAAFFTIIPIDFISSGLKQVRSHAAKAAHVIDASFSCAFIVE